MIRNSTAAMTTAISTYHAVPRPEDDATGAGAGAGAAVDCVAIGVVGGAATAGVSVLAGGGSDFVAGASVLAWASVASTSRSVTTSGGRCETTVAVISSPLFSCATGITLPSL